MTTTQDREQLLALNGTTAPHSRDSYRRAAPWRHEPTLITPAKNPPMLPSMVHQSGTNPFGDNPNRRKPGNPISTRVLSTSTEVPPRKKVKTEHTPFSHAASAGPHTQQGDRHNARFKRSHKIPLAPETIDVDDFNPWDSVMPGDNSHMSIGNSSPDELNIRSPFTKEAHPSKYPFNTSRHSSDVRNNNPPIAPDGENTEWAKEKFSQGLNDRISIRIPAPSGQVREEIVRIEAKTRMGDPPPKIDFAEMYKPKTKTKHKMKNRDNKPLGPQLSFGAQSSRTPAKPNVLPLKELYLDYNHYNSKGLEICWGKSDSISIKSDKVSIFGPFDIRVNGHSLTYHDASDLPVVHDPVFQLKTISNRSSHGTQVECLTIKLDCSNPGMQESYYTNLLNWLKDRVDEKEVVRGVAGERMWEAAAWAGATTLEFSTKPGNSGKNRLDELREGESRRAKRNLIDNQSNPLAYPKRSASQSSPRITPPIPLVPVSGNQKLKQCSRQDTNDLPQSVIPRRSTRNTSEATRPPAVDSDEVILVYPTGVPGAVNITNADLFRLKPGEFLNDTLIEFGLKLWLKDLEETNPTFASQIHVFNSFFYKKLNHQKKGTNLGGYESVRKWTSKFDIFQKKYIIVPINEHFHWYFAIICEPEHVLVPAVSNVPSTRQQTRQSIPMIVDEPSEPPTTSKPVSTSVLENDRDEDKLRTPSEAEVEQTLHDFQGSCSISNVENVADVDGRKSESPAALSYVSEDKLLPLSPTASDHERALLRHSPSDEKMAMDLAVELPANTTNHDNLVSEIRPVDASSFYAPSKRHKGKRKAPEPESFFMEIDDGDDDDGGSVLSDTSKTHIFIFDSLGGRHPQAINRLSAYLKMEAQDKKKIVNASNAAGKSALVPVQPNFCDCGIYLLHLAQTFMSDPAHYRRMILAQKSKASFPNSERQVAWHDHQVTNKREVLAARIIKLSTEWKKERAVREAKQKEEALNNHTFEVAESDGEIDILEPTPSTSKAKKKANRIRG